ncbi:MAG: ribonuclease E activity regulator RraA [Natronospirillum sp.]|uniref:ribonuclease E activity regulator RraA n=1 Tax=Natronospirillum sp. TaxID=2812955 RepID=UPI0025E19FB9|nr:ribonuclease E activity regulator RraA [Natronospirillum sp.]MCH8551754.1 ribonuclease E activity regulator RraA [Natronospirillum sp.]
MTFTATCDLYDEHEEALGVLPATLKDFGGRIRFQGPAVTIKCFEDNSRIKELSATPGHGRVLVVDGGGSLRCALLGDMIAKDLVDNGWAGAVIFGLVRDRAELAELDLGVKALGTIPRKSQRRGEGHVDLPIRIEGTQVNPGDTVVADEDGVVILASGA